MCVCVLISHSQRQASIVGNHRLPTILSLSFILTPSPLQNEPEFSRLKHAEITMHNHGCIIFVRKHRGEQRIPFSHRETLEVRNTLAYQRSSPANASLRLRLCFACRDNQCGQKHSKVRDFVSFSARLHVLWQLDLIRRRIRAVKVRYF